MKTKNKITKCVLAMSLLILSNLSLAGNIETDINGLREAARELGIHNDNTKGEIIRVDGNLWIKGPDKQPHLLGEEITNFGPGAYEENPFVLIEVFDEEENAEVPPKNPLTGNPRSLIFQIKREELLKLHLKKYTSEQLENLLAHRFKEKRRLSLQEYAARNGSVTEGVVKKAVKRAVQVVAGKLASGGLVDLVWPTKLGEGDDKPLSEYEETVPLSEYIEEADPGYPLMQDHLD